MKSHVVSLLASLVLLAGCATPQPPMSMSTNAFSAPGTTYGVLLTTIPVVDTAFPGASCLLCIAAASMANADLTKHAKSLPVDELAKLDVQLADALRKRGATVTMVPSFDLKTLPDSAKGAPAFSKKDFSSLKAKYHVDKLLVVQLSAVGFSRTYSAYFPTSDPKAQVAGEVYIVNLADNSLEWYKPWIVLRAADGKWDEPPKFPGLTNAWYQSIELARDEVLKPLIK
ncbi:MAG: hypothetical protein M3Y65_16200 [Pseudomonadota bacterium]|nr:hypothetical protein [Pseudomonadota bacterium]